MKENIDSFIDNSSLQNKEGLKKTGSYKVLSDLFNPVMKMYGRADTEKFSNACKTKESAMSEFNHAKGEWERYIKNEQAGNELDVQIRETASYIIKIIDEMFTSEIKHCKEIQEKGFIDGE